MENYRYKAFISYRHLELDRKWAVWFMEKLETFHVPESLVKNGAPRRIGHLYRDDDEIPASSDLSSEIASALIASEYLIVVCSPSTPTSFWVPREIEFFRSLGRGSRILAILVAGEPESAFPSQLKAAIQDPARLSGVVEQEPIAADVRERKDEPASQTRRRALLRVAATLIGCRFDDLAQRDRQRRLRVTRRIYAAVAALIIVVTGSAYWYWQYSRIETQYFAHSDEKWGVPVGVGSITATAAMHRMHVEIGYQRGRVVQFRIVNGHGWLWDGATNSSFDNGAVEKKIIYLGARDIDIKLYGYAGEFRGTQSIRFDPSNPLKATERLNSVLGSAKPLAANISSGVSSADLTPTSVHSAIAELQLRFDGNGFTRLRLFRNAYGEPSADTDGSYGQKFSYRPDGAELSRENLDQYGNTLVEKNGLAKLYTSKNGLGDVVLKSYLDEFGRPLATDGESAYESYSYDVNGNQVMLRNLGVGSKPAPNRFGDYTLKLHFNSFGDVVGFAYFDQNGRPASSMFAVHEAHSAFNNQGRVISYEAFGVDHKPILTTIKCHGWRKQYDELSRLVSASNVGVRGEPCQDTDGIYHQTNSYDRMGNVVEIKNTDPKGALHANKWGVAISKFSFNDDRELVAEQYFGANGAPVVTASGVSSLRYEYKRGNRVRVRAFDEHGHPVSDVQSGIADVRVDYDAEGNSTWIAGFDGEGKPQINKLGWAAQSVKYDKHGQVVEVNYYGVTGERLAPPHSAASIHFKYDDKGRQIERKHLGENLALMNTGEGFAILRTSYGKGGLESLSKYYDEHDKPVALGNKCASISQITNNRGQLVSSECFNSSGQPTLSADGYWKLVQTYDERGDVRRVLNFGLDGLPINNRFGYARRDQNYDASSHPTSTRFFDASGHLTISTSAGYAAATAVYDVRGNKVLRKFFGRDGVADLNSEGFAAEHFTYDAFGRETSEKYFDQKGTPTKSKRGYAEELMSYDARGNMTSDAYLDDKGRPVTAGPDSADATKNFGYASALYRYDERDNQIEESFFGSNGHPTSSAFGYSVSKSKYDPSGRMIDLAFFDPDGNAAMARFTPLTGRTFVARFLVSYGQSGRLHELNMLDKFGGVIKSIRGGG